MPTLTEISLRLVLFEGIAFVLLAVIFAGRFFLAQPLERIRLTQWGLAISGVALLLTAVPFGPKYLIPLPQMLVANIEPIDAPELQPVEQTTLTTVPAAQKPDYYETKPIPEKIVEPVELPSNVVSQSSTVTLPATQSQETSQHTEIVMTREIKPQNNSQAVEEVLPFATSTTDAAIENTSVAEYNTVQSNTSVTFFTKRDNVLFVFLAVFFVPPIVLLLREIRGQIRLWQLNKQSSDAPEEIAQVFREICGGSQKYVQLRLCSGISVPMVFGFFRVRLLIPASMRGVSQELIACLSHEWSHLKRGDLLTWNVMRLLQYPLWPQPFYWLLRPQLLADQDYIADHDGAMQLTDQAKYAEVLLNLAKNRTRNMPGSVLGMAGHKSELKRRIEMLLDTTRPIALKCCKRKLLPVIVLMTLLMIIGVSMRFGDAKSSQNTDANAIASENTNEETVSDASAQLVAETFLESLKNDRFDKATELFSDELRAECSEQTLREHFNRIKRSVIYTPKQKQDYSDRTEAGTLQSFDPPVKTEHIGGELWGSLLHFDYAVSQIRMVIGSGGKITAFEMISVDGKPNPIDAECCYNGYEIGKRLGRGHSIRVEFLDAQGNASVVENNNDVSIITFQQVKQLPSPESFPFSNQGPRYWTDPKDGSHWVRFWPEMQYAEKSNSNSTWYDIKTGMFSCNAFPAGTYRFAFTSKTYYNPEDGGHIALSAPVRVDAANKNVNITQRLIRGGTISIQAVDAESGEPIANVLFDGLKCDQAPSEITGVWTQYNTRSEVAGLYPGTYSFFVRHDAQTPNDRFCEPNTEKYVVEVVDGQKTEVEVKLRTRPQTLEELDESWPYVITGTIRDLQGNPLPNAKVKLMGFLGHRPGSTSTTTDESGQYKIRFAKYNIVTMYLTQEIEPTPEKPDVLGMAISVECPGFVWKGVRNSEGQIISDQFLQKNDNGIYSRVDSHHMQCFEPEPAKPRDPETDVYPRKPKTVDIVMQPAVHIRGRVLFDESPEKPTEDDRWYYPQAKLIFDLPRAETASWQPVFYGPIDEQLTFDLSALPHDIDAFVAVSHKLPASWKNDKIVAKTDFFKLPPVGQYDMTLRWKTTEGNGITMRRLEIASMTDADGNDFELVMTKPSEVVDYLFNHWTLTGTVRDDLGQPVEGADVKIFRTYGWRFYLDETITTDSQGNYSIKITPSQRTSDHPKETGIPVPGDVVMLQARKDGAIQKHIEQNTLVFLSDEPRPVQNVFYFGEMSTERHCEPLQSANVDLVLNRNPEIDVLLLDKNDKSLPGFTFRLLSDVVIDEDEDFKKEIVRKLRYSRTDGDGRCRLENIPTEIPFRFYLPDDANENDILQTDNITFLPGASYHVTLRYSSDEYGDRRLVLESVRDGEGNDVTAETVVKDPRTQPFLGTEETERGREILRKTISQIRPLPTIDVKDIDLLQYTFHLGDQAREYETEDYRSYRGSVQQGITWRSALHDLLNQSADRMRFRSIETDENEIRLQASIGGTTVFGNGIDESWIGYTQQGFDGAMIVLDAKTQLPKRIKTNHSEEEFFDWVPFGDPKEGQFVPLRIVCKTENMSFDFRFKAHENDVWLFDRSVAPEGSGEKTICRIDNVRIKRKTYAAEADENKVREALRKYYDANEYWLNWYPKDLPKFGYTFYQKDREPEVLTWDDIKAKDNWYAEFYRKGISYIGASRLLVIDIDALRCTRIVDDVENGTLEFDFELKQDWMNAVGNGVSGTWLGWFNGGIGKGTAVLDTKTMTLREIQTSNYDERYSDYVELKPGKFAPQRIVIDYHEGRKDVESDMFFDFRFKVYEPCLWLFDRSIETDNNGKEQTTSPVWVGDVVVEGQKAVEIP